MKLDLNDLLIVPAMLSDIKSRKRVNPYYWHRQKNKCFNKHLPIIAAPMDTVVDGHNFKLFQKNHINYCIPRGVSIDRISTESSTVMSFMSYGLDQFIEEFLNKTEFKENRYLLIDIANGHMIKLQQTVKAFKEKYADYYKLMVGNVANPDTYRILSESGADFIRIGIGNGNGCLTTQQLGVGYPIASLIKECYTIKQQMSANKRNAAMIVADGGMKGYSDIIKALALGSDYVMIGSILNQCLESAGPTYFMGIKIDQYSKYAKWLFKKGFKLKKKFRGMSTKEVQKSWNKNELKTSEGVVRYRKVESTLEGWAQNFTDYLRSAMSYTDKKSLHQFKGTVNFIQITDKAYLRFNK